MAWLPSASLPLAQALGFEPFPNSELRAYVALARRKNPHIPEELTEYLAAAYAEMRQEEVDSGERAHSYTTARTLLSIIRLAEALARLRFSDAVAQSDVDEALRLMKMSKASLGDPREQRRKGSKDVDPVTEIYQLLRAFAAQNDKLHIESHEVRAREREREGRARGGGPGVLCAAVACAASRAERARAD